MLSNNLVGRQALLHAKQMKGEDDKCEIVAAWSDADVGVMLLIVDCEGHMRRIPADHTGLRII